MGFGSDSQVDHDAEAAEQAEIEANLVVEPASEDHTPEEETSQAEVDGVEENPTVTIGIAEKYPDVVLVDEFNVPTGEVREGGPVEIDFPLTLSVATVDEDEPDEYTFESAADTFEVSPHVADQLQYVPAVEVVQEDSE